ncbi:MAG: hypothetical protein ACLFM3_08685, partial [Desulfohalobiaceae bacterium]
KCSGYRKLSAVLWVKKRARKQAYNLKFGLGRSLIGASDCQARAQNEAEVRDQLEHLQLDLNQEQA